MGTRRREEFFHPALLGVGGGSRGRFPLIGELGPIGFLQEPEQTRRVLGSESLRETGLAGDLLGRLGAPGRAEPRDEGLTDRPGQGDQALATRRGGSRSVRRSSRASERRDDLEPGAVAVANLLR